MYRAFKLADGQNHKRFRVFKKSHNREMNDVKSEVTHIKSELTNQSQSMKSIVGLVSSLAESVSDLRSRFASDDEISSSSSSSDSTESQFSASSSAKRSAKRRAKRKAKRRAKRRARRAKRRGADTVPNPVVTVNAVNAEIEEEEEDKSSAIPDDKFHNCCLSLLGPKLDDEIPEVVVGYICRSGSYEINRDGDNIHGLIPTLWLGSKLVEERNGRVPKDGPQAKPIRLVRHILSGEASLMKEIGTISQSEEKYAIVAFFYLKSRQLYFVFSKATEDMVTAEVFPILSGAQVTYEGVPDISSEIDPYLFGLHNLGDEDAIECIDVQQYEGGNFVGNPLPGYMQKSRLPRLDVVKSTNTTSLFIVKSPYKNVCASAILTLARFLVVSMEEDVKVHPQLSYLYAEKTVLPLHLYFALTLDKLSFNQKFEELVSQEGMTDTIEAELKQESYTPSILYAFYLAASSLHHLLTNSMVFGDNDEQFDRQSDDDVTRVIAEWNEGGFGKKYADQINSLEWLGPPMGTPMPSHRAFDFNIAEDFGNVQGESDRLIFCLLFH